MGAFSEYAAFTPLFNTTGQPAMSVPPHRSADGLPVGAQFVGRFADEDLLFRLADQIEQARPWRVGVRPFMPEATLAGHIAHGRRHDDGLCSGKDDSFGRNE